MSGHQSNRALHAYLDDRDGGSDPYRYHGNMAGRVCIPVPMRPSRYPIVKKQDSSSSEIKKQEKD